MILLSFVFNSQIPWRFYLFRLFLQQGFALFAGFRYKLNTSEIVAGFKCTHSNLETAIEQKYSERIFILKNGDLEDYLGIHNKGLPGIIKFCNENLKDYLEDNTNEKSKEIRFIFDEITK